MIEVQHVLLCIVRLLISLSRLIDLLMVKMYSKKKRQRSCPFSNAKKELKWKSSKVFNKEWAEALATSDKGSYFDQDNLVLSTELTM